MKRWEFLESMSKPKPGMENQIIRLIFGLICLPSKYQISTFMVDNYRAGKHMISNPFRTGEEIFIFKGIFCSSKGYIFRYSKRKQTAFNPGFQIDF